MLIRIRDNTMKVNFISYSEELYVADAYISIQSKQGIISEYNSLGVYPAIPEINFLLVRLNDGIIMPRAKSRCIIKSAHFVLGVARNVNNYYSLKSLFEINILENQSTHSSLNLHRYEHLEQTVAAQHQNHIISQSVFIRYKSRPV